MSDPVERKRQRRKAWHITINHAKVPYLNRTALVSPLLAVVVNEMQQAAAD